jgi:hypothetical protein
MVEAVGKGAREGLEPFLLQAADQAVRGIISRDEVCWRQAFCDCCNRGYGRVAGQCLRYARALEAAVGCGCWWRTNEVS